MNRITALAVSVLLFAAPAWAGTLSYYDSLGGSGVTALYAPSSGLVSDIDYDAGSAEGGSLLFGASEILIVPLGDAELVSFDCQLAAGCGEDDYVFVAGGAGTGYVLVSDPDSNAQNSVLELGDITWDSLLAGSLELSSCNYTTADAVERTCDPFTLAETSTTVPEPGTGVLVGLALAAIGVARRRR